MESPNKEVVFARGKKIYLRPLDEKDIPTFCRWFNDQEVTQFLAMYWPMSEITEREWFNRYATSKTDILLSIVTLDHVVIGNTGLTQINWKDRTAVSGAMIGEKEYWEKGCGTESKMLLLNYAFNTLNLRKVCSSAYAHNQRSLSYNLNCGYKEEGRRVKQIYRNGEYRDAVLIAVFKEDWMPIWERFQKTGSVK